MCVIGAHLPQPLGGSQRTPCRSWGSPSITASGYRAQRIRLGSCLHLRSPPARPVPSYNKNLKHNFLFPFVGFQICSYHFHNTQVLARRVWCTPLTLSLGEEAGWSLWVQSYSSLYIELLNNQSYVERACLTTKNQSQRQVVFAVHGGADL